MIKYSIKLGAYAIVLLFPVHPLCSEPVANQWLSQSKRHQVKEPSQYRDAPLFRISNSTASLIYQSKENINSHTIQFVLVPEDIQLQIKSSSDDQAKQLQRDREERDLSAQEEMAFWGKFSFWVSFGSLLLTALGVVYVSRTIQASTRAERPHVRLFTTIKRKDKNGRILETQGVTFRNYGRTPALIRRLNISYVLADSPPDPRKCTFERTYPDDSVMPQDELWPYKGFIPQFEGMPVNELVKEHKRTGKRLFVYGKIVYADAFGKERYTRFCREFNGRSFTYNRSDVNENKRLNFAT
ncbi:hypothetical protein [Mesorhizobium sp.]|uniref:hypothetical protein n=1 Tax=Mesorhizobium sp. TaxID=1871066 RepID=UPI000FE8279E|nr:hypothetical protein [Mesorhizobium sp.]RWI23754.1 MAG: hypothetical protein EOQ92_13680 [Mesorhizobium sp.]RWK91785.1 MAG: hypothetical protein EOR53_28115 [Mesorhizobium sp.]TIQ21562.1 MAG: hypothetical protein E5X51_10000 [Mesorhizobium sp.]TIQ31462.1 MAG: hypothetical protein E5X54_06670 [Mesorhizobium sp.]TJW48613.1 MAG: hypothetical protein E5X59_10840 [Mesorhizobium sp.]